MSTLPEDLAERDPTPPSRWLLASELSAAVEWSTAPWRLSTRGLPRGDGHPVMVLPGFGAGDRATWLLRRALRQLGYACEGWGQGRNLGMRRPIGAALDARIGYLAEQNGPVSLIGWSLGGVFARELARARPDAVRRVITLGSPIAHHPSANNMERLFRLANPTAEHRIDWDGFLRREQAPPVPCTAIRSQRDGIVAWRCCQEREGADTENIAVRGSHMAMVANPQVLAAIARRLHADS